MKNQTKTYQPRKITQKRLNNIAIYYLERFPSSVDNLRQVLRRRVRKTAFKRDDVNENEAFEWIEEIVKEMQRLGYVDDQAFARGKTNYYLNKGKSLHYVRQYLRQKGIASDEIDATFAALDASAEDVDLQAAWYYARKRGFGPYRVDASSRTVRRDKDIAAMLRQGFKYNIVKCVIDAEEIDEDFGY